MPDPEIVVLRRGVHGMPIEEFVAAIEARLPDYEVRPARSPREERELVERAPIATGMQISDGVLAAADDLELFACTYAGTDHLPTAELAERGVTVTNAAGVHGPNAAEQVIGSMLGFARGLFEARRRQGRREWRHFQVEDFHGSTVTVVGLGNIGGAIVERLEGFGVDTIGVRYTPSKGGPTDEVIGFDADDFHDALGRTDYLVLACPLTDTTAGLIDARALETLPPDATLVNVARGPVVDTDALVDTLYDNEIGAAMLDVTDPEPLPEDHALWNFENVLITPHNAGHTPAYYERVADILAENVDRIEKTGSYEGLRNQVVP